MKIVKIEKLKNGKYKLNFEDDSIITYDEVILKYNLLFKNNIDSNMYNKIIEENRYYDIYCDCEKYSLKKRRSEKEIYNYLIKKEINNNTINSIISKLKNINLINDREYANAFINDKILLSDIGINKIKEELIKNNIDESIINEELSKIDTTIFDSKLKKIVLKKVKSNKKYSSSNFKNKLLNELILKGYNKDSILQELEHYQFDDIPFLEKEYNKLKNKYENSKIIQKLLSKGFRYDDILNIIKTEGE